MRKVEILAVLTAVPQRPAHVLPHTLGAARTQPFCWTHAHPSAGGADAVSRTQRNTCVATPLADAPGLMGHRFQAEDLVSVICIVDGGTLQG